MKITEYDTSHPYNARVVKSDRITPEKTDEVRHITLVVPDATFSFLEGQSIGVLVPGPHPFGNDQYLRLYSIASSRQGEDQNLAEVSICVRRCFYIDDISGERYPGIASNYLCDRRSGETVSIVGPYGGHFLAPKDTTCNLLMIGVGTGIAPFRAFLKHIYEERQEWVGQVRLFHGARTGMELLYKNDKKDDLSLYYNKQTFKAFEALSPRPHFDEPASVERTVKDNAHDVWALIQDPKTYVYVSGLTQLEKKLDDILAKIAGSEDQWQAEKQNMIQEHRWSTMFYG